MTICRFVLEARDVVPERPLADDDAGGVLAGVTREPLELLRLLDELARDRIAVTRSALSFGSTSSASGMVYICPWHLVAGIRLASSCASLAGMPMARATSLMTLRALSSWNVAICPTDSRRTSRAT